METDRTELTRQVIDLQQQMNKSFGQVCPDAWMNIGLTIAQLKSLFFIAREGQTNFKKLACALKVTPSNVTGIIDRLVDQDLVSRHDCREDRRIMLLQITEKGQGLLNSLNESRASQMKEVLAKMTAEELQDLERGMSALVKATQCHETRQPVTQQV